MNWLFEKDKIIKITGLLAIFGMTIVLIVDLKLLYLPLPLKEYSTFRAAMTRSREEILLYSKFAIFAIPFVLVGLFHIFITILRSNRLLAWVTTLVFAYGYINAAFYYAILGYVMTAAHVLVPLKLRVPFFTEHIYHLFQLQYFGSIIAGSFLFFLSLSFFKHNYPKKYIWFNPLYLIGIFRFILPMIAAPSVTGFLLTATFNAIMLFTVTFSTIILWTKPVEEVITSKTTGLETA